MRSIKWSAALMLVLSSVCSAQTSAPTSAPTTAPTKITFPASFSRIEVGGHTVVCEAVDEKWVRTALGNVKPATRPSTMPSDILAKIQSTRQDIVKQMAADTLLPEKDIDEAYDKYLIPVETKAAGMKMNLLILVTTKERLADLMKAGMTLPNFHYNALTNEVSYSPNLSISENEQVVHSLYTPATAESARAETLATRIREIDGMRMSAESQQGAMIVQQFFAGLVNSKVVAPMTLKDDQAWFAQGLIEWLTIKYFTPVLGINTGDIIQRMTAQPRYPIRLASIDLLHPEQLKDMKPEYAAAYRDALGRRSLALVYAWVKRDGDSVIPKSLAAFKKAPPADGPALVKMIKDATGTDLSPDLKPQL